MTAMAYSDLPNHLEAWLTYIAQLHPQTICLELTRVRKLAIALHLISPSGMFSCAEECGINRPMIITVAGTNGKGSCVALLEAIWVEAGYRVASYTSPHLFSFLERIRLNQVPVTEQQFMRACTAIEQKRSELNLSLTFFEYMTLVALWLFRTEKPDVIILEVGLGGRFDAVNIVDSDIAVITQIGLDHTDRLGNDRETIAHQKAGILRAKRPVICGDSKQPISLKQNALDLKSPLYSVAQQFFYKMQGKHWSWWCASHYFERLPMPKLLLANAATALMTVYCASNRLPITDQALYKGIEDANLVARCQICYHPHWCVFDVAHNMDAVKHLAACLHPLPCRGRTYAVVGMLADKLIIETIQPLLAYVDVWCLASLNVPRGAEAKTLGKALECLGVQHYDCFESVAEAYQNATLAMGKHDRMLVFGSFHTVADAQRLFFGMPQVYEEKSGVV